MIRKKLSFTEFLFRIFVYFVHILDHIESTKYSEILRNFVLKSFTKYSDEEISYKIELSFLAF